MFKVPNDPMPVCHELMRWSWIVTLIMRNWIRKNTNNIEIVSNGSRIISIIIISNHQVDLILQTQENGWNPFWIIQKVQKPNLGQFMNEILDWAHFPNASRPCLNLFWFQKIFSVRCLLFELWIIQKGQKCSKRINQGRSRLIISRTRFFPDMGFPQGLKRRLFLSI